MQNLDIKQLAEQTSWVIASVILINCPTVTVTATTIPSSYFILTVLTNYSILTDCSISTILDLYRY
jgi:hypothetical protein